MGGTAATLGMASRGWIYADSGLFDAVAPSTLGSI